MFARKITDGITIAGQPNEGDITKLAERGYRTVVNLRKESEPGVLPEEKRLVEEAGMNYASIPVASDTLDDLTVERFIQAVESDDSQPAVVHCGGGGRAGIMTLLQLAMSNGWSLEKALADGAKLGIAPAPDSPYRPFLENFIKRHSPAER